VNYRATGYNEVSLDSWTVNGQDDDRLGEWDRYPSHDEHTPDEVLAHVMDALLPILDGEERHVLELHFVAGMSYRDVAIEMGWYEGVSVRRPNKKRAQRMGLRAVEKLRSRVSDGWARELAVHRMPR